jgi:glycosyltransferase involved in cell wall biosynthesis
MSAQAGRRLAVIGHPLAAEENRMAFRGWSAFAVDLVAPASWRALSLGHVYRAAPASASGVGEPALHALPTWLSGRNSLFLWRGLDALLARLKPDLIYCWEEPWCLSSLQARHAARRLGVPLVFYTAENRPKRLPWPFAALMRALFREARACVAPTSEIADTIRSAGFPGPILAIPLWIRPRRPVRADASARTLAYVGRLIPLKRVHLLVEALALLPGWRLRVIGDGPERGRLEALARSLGVAGACDFRGHVENAALEESLDGCSMLVLPTGENARQAEQFGKAALEAVSCGLPVLASATGNLARLAETFPTLAARDLDTAAAMAAAVAGLAAAYPEAGLLAEGRDRVIRRFGPDAAGRALEASFASLCAPGWPARGAPPPLPAPVREALR